MREQQERSLSGHVVDDEDTEDQNVQIIRLIAALGGNKDRGRRAILSAMAATQGVSSEQDIDDLLSGTAKRRLQVPAYLRSVLSDIGLGDAIAPLNLFELVGGADRLLLQAIRGATLSSKSHLTQVLSSTYALPKTAQDTFLRIHRGVVAVRDFSWEMVGL